MTPAPRRTCTGPRSCSPTPTLIRDLGVGATVIPLPTAADPAVADTATVTSAPSTAAATVTALTSSQDAS